MIGVLMNDKYVDNNIASKLSEKKGNNLNLRQPTLRTKKLTRGQIAADWLAKWAGSWTFITIFMVFLFSWIFLNTYAVLSGVWDEYPFILLNLILSCIAAIQAPIILMSQNREGEIDRQRAQYDYLVNRKAEREIKQVQLGLLELKQAVLKQSTKTQTQHLRDEIKKIQDELNNLEEKVDMNK